MSRYIDTGGEAFPSDIVVRPEDEVKCSALYGCGGMTLRDYFAAAALNQMLRWEAAEGLSYEEIAEQAYLCADAMIAGR